MELFRTPRSGSKELIGDARNLSQEDFKKSYPTQPNPRKESKTHASSYFSNYLPQNVENVVCRKRKKDPYPIVKRTKVSNSNLGVPLYSWFERELLRAMEREREVN